jgi:hypothetical protein
LSPLRLDGYGGSQAGRPDHVNVGQRLSRECWKITLKPRDLLKNRHSDSLKRVNLLFLSGC